MQTTEISNHMEENLSNDLKFLKGTQKALVSLYNTKDKPDYTDQYYQAKSFSDSKNHYLVVKQRDIYSVFKEPKGVSEPFQYIVEGLSKGDSLYYGNKLVSIDTKHEFKKTNKSVGSDDSLETALGYFEDLEKWKDSDNPQKEERIQEIQQKLQDLVTNPISVRPTFTTNRSAYELKNFYNFLYEVSHFPTELDDNFWLKQLASCNSAVQSDIEEIKLITEFLFDMCEKHKFTSKKKYSYNDTDSQIWAEAKGIILTNQGAEFYITLIGEEITVYCSEVEKNNLKKHSNLNNLLVDLEKNPDSLVDNGVLKLKGDKVTFVDNNLWFAFSMDLESAKMSLVQDKKGVPGYPVDVTDYDYQLKYYQSRFKVSEFEFVAQALLTIGGGFDYDKVTGRFIDDEVGYSSKVEKFKIRSEPTVFKKFNYCLPKKGITHLDEKWLKGAAYMVEVLKRDNPVPIVSDTDDKTADVLKAANYFENVIKKINKKNNVMKKG